MCPNNIWYAIRHQHIPFLHSFICFGSWTHGISFCCFFSHCILCFHLFRHIRLDLMYRSCIDSQGLIKNHLPTEIKFQVLLRYDNWNESFCMRPVRTMFECWLLINIVYWIVAEAIQTSIVSIIRCTIWYHCGQHNVMRTANLKIKKNRFYFWTAKKGEQFLHMY